MPDMAASLDYIDGVFNDYACYGGFVAEDLRGKSVLEIGPGDNLGVALKFMAAGAMRVTCLDKYDSVSDPDRQQAIYTALRERLGGGFQGGNFPRVIRGIGIEDAVPVLHGEKFDLIVSRAVMEHVVDPKAAFAAMDRLLHPSGALLHKIDFRDHGLFTSYGYHPLTFLTVGDAPYRLMSRQSGRPNRALIGDYKAIAAELGYGCEIHVTHVLGKAGDLLPHPLENEPGFEFPEAGKKLLEEIRPRLNPRFARKSESELLTTGAFLKAVKRR